MKESDFVTGKQEHVLKRLGKLKMFNLRLCGWQQRYLFQLLHFLGFISLFVSLSFYIFVFLTFCLFIGIPFHLLICAESKQILSDQICCGQLQKHLK